MPPNYREQQGRPLNSHEKKGALVLAAAMVVAGASLGIWAAVERGSQPKGKCVIVNVASSTGGGRLEECGAAARSWCASEATATGPVAVEIQAACRREGFLAQK